MVYADYDYYKTAYLGTAIAESDFPRLALRASSFLDYYTQGRAGENPSLDALKMACCAVAEQYRVIDVYQSRSIEGQEKQSESVGSWSVSYRGGAEASQEAQTQLKNAAAQYLARTGILYRGRRCGTCDYPTL